ncbi:MAG: NAD(P)H-binding protein [Pseudonocardiaceae bacterium]|nr:NAD(P)H-binding protein [Pseudonocardiaceae bacterium]
MPDELIAVTGATGALGGRIARRLAARNVPQRLVVRTPARAPRLGGTEIATASYGDAGALHRALRGVATLLLVSASEDADRVALHTSTVDAALGAGVSRIVYVSFLGAGPDATFTFARHHGHTEQHIRGTGAAFTFLRNSLYLDMLPAFVGDDGVIRGPAGAGKVGAVARDDIADVAVEVLLGDGHDGLGYDVTGREAITLSEAAAQLARAAGRPITYHAETLDEARASRAGYGVEAWELEGWVSSYAAIATGELDVVTDTVPELTGHPAMTLSEHLQANPLVSSPDSRD